ncbi:CARDB domain-containing protein [Actinokineospora guangxiensis]|uniref:CARDB domain-containing protein n=1 Tax=Actinokineospora guangxiensis TaxID=1490288 RepID=A0ABW0EM49_9PSEU
MRARHLSVAVVAAALIPPLLGVPGLTAQAAPGGPNLVAGATVSTSSTNDVYGSGNLRDGNQGTYWESRNNAFPQWAQADLGAAVPVERVVLKLPAGWEARTQTLAVQGSENGSSFADIVPSRGYEFSPARQNTVTIDFPAAPTRFIRVNITANTGWPAGQLAELEAYGPQNGGDTQAPTAPGNLAFTEPAPNQVRLSWTASTDNVGVTGYDVYANGAVRTSVGANVLTFTDTQPAGAIVSYTVRAKDAAGNASADSNRVTRGGSGENDRNLAQGKTLTASGHVWEFRAQNANDGNVATYWEGNGQPATLTAPLGANSILSSVVVRLNPDAAWGPRTQTIEVLGRDQGGSAFRSLVAARQYSFSPASSNVVRIPVTATAADVQLRFTANTGAPGGQVAELEVMGRSAPNPDFVITALTSSPAAPVETSPITASVTVRNAGALAAPATTVNVYLGDDLAGTAAVGALAAGASATVQAALGAHDAGQYQISAKVDENNAVTESNETNNGFVGSTITVTPVPSSDLVPVLTYAPNVPNPGSPVTFSVALRNQGTIASAGGAHPITVRVLGPSGTVVRTLTGTYTGAIAAGTTSPAVSLGSWTAVAGRHTVETTVAADANELEVKRANNTVTTSLFAGRGANMPFDILEAEDGTLAGGAALYRLPDNPNWDRQIGSINGEASGRKAVTLNQNGASVEWTTRAPTNTLVTRFSIPDGTNTTLNIYVNGAFHKAIPLTAKYAWLYGPEHSPGNDPIPGQQRHIYDEANIMLDSTFPAGSKIKLQKDAQNTGTFAVDFISTELATELPNPDPARYAQPTGFTHQAVQAAMDRVRMDTTGTLVGVYLPKGSYDTNSKFQVYGKPVQIVGAGVWFTRFIAGAGQENTDVGFRADATANGSRFAHFSLWGNYTRRIDGPGKVFDFQNVANITIEHIWAEHFVCLYWGANTDNMVIRDTRSRNLFADAVNMTNGSTGNRVVNNESRASGDDSFALFSAIDAGGADMKDNVYENLTAILTWRAAGIAVYGGYNNVFRNIYVADTLTYSGITISSLDFGYPMNGFGADPPTRFENISLVRTGGTFWNGQTFAGIWIFSASKVFQGIRVSDVDIISPTYSGVMFQTNYVGQQPQFPVADTIFTNVTIDGARRSLDAYANKSGIGIWCIEAAEQGQGPARGTATFNGTTFGNNDENVRCNTPTFTLVQR